MKLLKAAIIMLVAGTIQAKNLVVYDFNSLANGVLNGQDNWTYVSGTANQNTVSAGAVIYGGSTTEKSKRVNNANWSFAGTIAGSTTIDLSYKARIGTFSGGRGSELFFMAGSTDVVSLGFNSGNKKFFITAADATTTFSTSAGTTLDSESKYLKMAIDLAGNGGEGSGTFLQSTDGTTWTEVAGLENINLQLTTSGVADTATWDAIALERVGYSAIDDITIGAVPEPMTETTIYDFNTLANGVLNGKDNWTHVSGTANNNAVLNGAVNYGNAIEKSKRVNDANWSFAGTIARSPEIELSYKTRISTAKTDYRRASELFFMAGSTNVVSFGYDYTNTKFFITAADGTTTLSTANGTASDNEYKWLKLAIDLEGHAGEGSATFYQSPPADGTNWTAVAGLQNVDLQLATSGVNGTTTWDAIAFERVYYSAIDNITIGVLKSGEVLAEWNFNNLNASTNGVVLEGQDGWIKTSTGSASVYNGQTGTIPPASFTNYIKGPVTNLDSQYVRANDGSISYALSATNEFTLQMDVRAGDHGRSCNQFMALAAFDGEGALVGTPFTFGSDGWVYGYSIRTGALRPSALYAHYDWTTSEMVTLKVVVDPTANDGDGSADLYGKALDESSWTTLLTGVNLSLKSFTGYETPDKWNGVYIRASYPPAVMDNLKVMGVAADAITPPAGTIILIR